MEKRPAIGGPERCECRKNAANVGNKNDKAQSHSHGQENIPPGINDEGDKEEYILGVDSPPLSNFLSFFFSPWKTAKYSTIASYFTGIVDFAGDLEEISSGDVTICTA
jgi:hypothetical protein